MRVQDLENGAGFEASVVKLQAATDAVADHVEAQWGRGMDELTRAVVRVVWSTSIGDRPQTGEKVTNGTEGTVYGGHNVHRGYHEGDMHMALVTANGSSLTEAPVATLVARRGDTVTVAPAGGFPDLLTPSPTHTERTPQRVRPFTLFVDPTRDGGTFIGEQVSNGSGRPKLRWTSLDEYSPGVQEGVIVAATTEVARAAGVINLLPKAGRAWYKNVMSEVYVPQNGSRNGNRRK